MLGVEVTEGVLVGVTLRLGLGDLSGVLVGEGETVIEGVTEGVAVIEGVVDRVGVTLGFGVLLTVILGVTLGVTVMVGVTLGDGGGGRHSFDLQSCSNACQ
jgi:hypothetical protein